MPMKSTLILLRHGQSQWNKKNLFTGWIDIPLSQEGIDEAIEAGKLIKDISIDMIFTSKLIRGSMTAMLAMTNHSSRKIPVMEHVEGRAKSWATCYSTTTEKTLIPVISAWELNERMYGELQGLNKDETRAKFGKEQVEIWRRSFDVPPPGGESLKMTAERTIPYFESAIVPYLKEGKNILVSAHGNSLRSIIMKLDNLSKDEVVSLEIPTGKPLFYTYENGSFSKS